MEITFMWTPGRGSSNGRHYKPASATVQGINKRSRIKIKNDDQLCLARALVTMQARVDGGPNGRYYKNLAKGYPIQEQRAKELHQLAGVPEGPCGIEEIKKFQQVLPEYQIKVISITPPHMVIFEGPESDKIIRIIKDGDHYDGCSSFKGFINKSYFCNDCDLGFDHDDFKHHHCDGKFCPSCKSDKCQDFKTPKQSMEPGKRPFPKELCKLCNRKFFGDNCYNGHLQRRSKTIRSICNTYKKCPHCCQVYKNDDNPKNRNFDQHVCGE